MLQLGCLANRGLWSFVSKQCSDCSLGYVYIRGSQSSKVGEVEGKKRPSSVSCCDKQQKVVRSAECFFVTMQTTV